MRKVVVFFLFLALAAFGGPLARAGEAKAYTLVYLKTGPQSGRLPEAETKAAFEGHFANMERLAKERKLLVAGPFGEVIHDPNLRGLFVLNSGKSEEAREWAATDPPTKAGIFVLEYHRLATEADLPAALERHFTREAKAAQEGRELKLEETMRSYVWLIADERAKARRELESLVAQNKVFLMGDLDDTRLLILLDAGTAAKAKEQFGATLGRVGTYQLDEWYGSSELATFSQSN